MVAICEPVENSFRIENTTQWMDCTQRAVANVLGIKNSSCIEVQVKQLGGAFGGKLTRGNFTATAAALAASHLNVPVKVYMNLNECMVNNNKNICFFFK